MFKKKFGFSRLFFYFLTLVACRPSKTESTSNNSTEPIVIKIGDTDSSSRSTKTLEQWARKSLEEKAPGKFKVEVYPDGQLREPPDLVAGV